MGFNLQNWDVEINHGFPFDIKIKLFKIIV